MKLGLLYAGQGSQHPGMGQDLYETNPVFRQAFDKAGSKVDFDLKTVCFQDPDGILNETKYTQPCMVAFQVAMTAVLKDRGIVAQAAYTAGLSLGEYSALQAAGLWSEEEAVEIAAFRGKAMAEAAKGVDCGMTAVIGLTREDLEGLLEENCYITNDNCPGQLVISGEKSAVAKTTERAKEAGALKAVPLKVSGPFHTPYMSPAGDALQKYLPTKEMQDMHLDVVYNFLGRPEKDADVPFLLEKQVQNGVRMRESLMYMLEQGVDTFLEVGPGHTLGGFIKRTAKEMQKSGRLPEGVKAADIQILSVETAEDLHALGGLLHDEQERSA